MEKDVINVLNERYEALAEYTKLLEEEIVLTCGYTFPSERLKEIKNNAEYNIKKIKEERIKKHEEIKNMYEKADSNNIYTTKEIELSKIKQFYRPLIKEWNSFYEDLIYELLTKENFSYDLCMYLLEYCVSLNKTSSSYIKAAASSWISKGLNTYEKAKEHVEKFKKEKLEKKEKYENFKKKNYIRKSTLDRGLEKNENEKINEVSLDNINQFT